MPGRSDRRRSGLTSVSLERRRLGRWLIVPAAQFVVPALAWASIGRIASARIWPAQEYTRVVFEAPDSVAPAGERIRTDTIP